MPATIIGLQDNKFLAGKQNFIREDNGLERIYQEYYFKAILS